MAINYQTSSGTQLSPAPQSPDPVGPKTAEQQRKLKEQQAKKVAASEKADIEMQSKILDLQKKSVEADQKAQEAGMGSDATSSAQMDPAAEQQPAEAYRGETQFDDPLMQMLVQQSQPDPAQVELEAQLRKAFEGSMANQQAEVDRLKSLRDDLAKPSDEKDLSGLLQFVDMATGSDYASKYVPPKSKEQAMQQEAALQAQIAKLQGAMTDDQLNYLKSQLQRRSDTKQADMLYKLKVAEQRQKRYEDRALRKENTRLSKEFEKDNQEAETEIEMMNNLEGLLKPDPVTGMVDFQSVQQALGLFARKIGGEKGVLTERDVGRVIPRSLAGDIAGLKAYFSKVPTAELRPEFVKNLRRAIARARENAKEKWQKIADARRNAGRRNRFNKDLWLPGAEWDHNTSLFMDKINKGFTATETPGDIQTPEVEGAAPAAPRPAPAAGAASGSGPGGSLSFEEWRRQKRGQ